MNWYKFASLIMIMAGAGLGLYGGSTEAEMSAILSGACGLGVLLWGFIKNKKA